MKYIHPTPEESGAAKSTFNAALITTLAICFTLCFGFFKLEKTTSETKAITELEIRAKEADTRNVLAREGKLFEYRPIQVSFRSITAGTAYTPSVSRYTLVSIPVQIGCTVTLTGGAAGNYALQTSPDGTTYTTVAQLTNSSTGTLVVGLTLNNTNGASLAAVVPPNYFYKLVSTSTTGSPTFSILAQSEETLL